MTDNLSAVERLLRRDRQVVIGSLVLVSLLAWIYTVAGAGLGSNASELSRAPWIRASEHNMPLSEMSYIFVLFAMWWVMMIAMMLPSAAPTILLASALNRRSVSDRPPYGTAFFFTCGYLLAWVFFSLIATIGQIVLENNRLMTAMMNSNSTALSAWLLIAAGVWQFTPIKKACLRHCRSPVEFLTSYRRSGNSGALTMGLHHGIYCLGCCWFLMILLFVGGIMNTFWIAGIALFVLVEKLFSQGVGFGHIAGAVLIVVGTALLVL